MLRRNLERAAARGFTVYVAPELEFFLFDDAESGRPLDIGSYFDQTALDLSQDFRRIAIAMLERMGISVMQSHHEIAPSQHEIDLREADALTMADNVMSARLVVKEAALEQVCTPPSCPSRARGWPGRAWTPTCRCTRATATPSTTRARRRTCPRRPAASSPGCWSTHEYTAVTNQWINSYKRLVPGFDAPTFICWAQRNRSAMVRVGGYRSDRVDVEVRSPDRRPTPTWPTRCCWPRA